jgi:hypothetical protein
VFLSGWTLVPEAPFDKLVLFLIKFSLERERWFAVDVVTEVEKCFEGRRDRTAEGLLVLEVEAAVTEAG